MKLKNAEATTSDTNATLDAVTPELVPLTHLLAHNKIKNRPIDQDHVEALYHSIKREGLDQPLDTWAGEKDGTKMKLGEDTVPANFLIAGFHRREAIKKLKTDDVKRYNELFPGDMIPVRRRNGTLVEMICLQLRENAARNDPSPSDLITHMEFLRDEAKMKNVAIARSIGKSEAWVSRIFSVGEELGEEGADALKKGEVGVREALAATDEVKKARKAGKSIDAKEAVSKAKNKTAARKASGKSRAEKRVSASTLLGRYSALPKNVAMGRRITILEDALKYVAKESEKLPAELQRDAKKDE